MSRSLTKQEAQHQQIQQQQQYSRDLETQEHHASANASAGLNLNLFGALSGAFSSTSKKSTHQKADDSCVTVEDKHDQGGAKAIAQGQGNAYVAGNAQEYSLKAKERGLGQQASQARKVEGKKQVDHLGLEG